MAKLKITIEYLFYLFIFLLPWQTRLIWQDAYLNGYVWEYGRLSLYGTALFLWLVLGLYGIWLFKIRHLTKISFADCLARLKKPAVLIYWLAVLFLLWAGLSVAWAMDSQLAFQRWLVLLTAGALFSLAAVFELRLGKIAVSWVAASILQSLFAIWQFFSQYSFASKWLGLAEHYPTVAGSIILETETQRWLRAYGSLPHPNILAGFLAIGFFFLIYLALASQKLSQRIFVWAGLITITPGIFFTFSRSAWIALAICFSVFVFWLWQEKEKNQQRIFFQLMAVFLVIIVILSFNFSPLLFTRFSGTQRLEAQSLELRLAFNRQAMVLIKDSPVLGQGIGNYTLGVFEKINAAWPGYYYQPAHNIYLLVWAELGIIGLLLSSLIFGALFWTLRKSRFSLEQVIVFLSLIVILIISLFDHYFWTLDFGVMIFWLILGLNLRQLRLNKE